MGEFIAPAASVFAPSQVADPYTSVLARQTGNAPLDYLNHAALGFMPPADANSSGRISSYLSGLHDVNAMNAANQEADRQQKAAGEFMNALPQLTAQGVGTAITPASNPYYTYNKAMPAQQDLLHAGKGNADVIKQQLDGDKVASDLGYTPPSSVIGGHLAGPLGTTPVPVQTNYLTPEQTDKKTQSAAQMLTAEGSYYSAHQPKGSGGGKPVSASMQIGIGQDAGLPPSITYRGSKADIDAMAAKYGANHGGGGNAGALTPQQQAFVNRATANGAKIVGQSPNGPILQNRLGAKVVVHGDGTPAQQ